MKKQFLGTYILKDGIAVPEPDMKKWGEFASKIEDRRVALTEIHHCTVSTVFLGLDHNFYGGEYPVLYETMVFMGEASQKTIDSGRAVPFLDPKDGTPQQEWSDMRRYSFRCEALEGHHETVKAIEKLFGQTQDKVSGLLYGIINAEEWTRDTV